MEDSALGFRRQLHATLFGQNRRFASHFSLGAPASRRRVPHRRKRRKRGRISRAKGEFLAEGCCKSHQRHKSEIRRPKAERRPKSEARIGGAAFRISGFGLLSDFGIRPSGFECGILLQQPLSSLAGGTPALSGYMPAASRTFFSCSSSRLGDTGIAVPSSCAKTETLNSSTIQRNSSNRSRNICEPPWPASSFLRAS